VGYVVLGAGKEVNCSDLRQRLRETLPDYMVPVSIMELPAFPMTPSGKVDRKCLPAPKFISATVSPQNQQEEQLAAIFAEVLDIENVGVADSFFDLGGDSISSIRLANMARRAGFPITPRDIFQHQSIQALLRAIHSSGQAS
jgi:acyl carrier protein